MSFSSSWKCPEGCLTCVCKPVSWLWLHRTTSLFHFTQTSFVSTAHRSLENITEAKYRSPCMHAVSRCLPSFQSLVGTVGMWSFRQRWERAIHLLSMCQTPCVTGASKAALLRSQACAALPGAAPGSPSVLWGSGRLPTGVQGLVQSFPQNC